jgi:selenium metabolism protein YedF
MHTVLIVRSEVMGEGDPALGARILQTMFNKLGVVQGLEAIVFYNGGVKLLAEGSNVLQALAALEQQGIDLIACGTCVDFYGLREQIKVGAIGSMDGILSTLSRAEKTITI